MAENVEEAAVQIVDTDTKSALAEVIALAGSRDEAAFFEDMASYKEVAARVEEAPIVRLANTILQSAIKAGASHIHIEPNRRYTGVYFRIDGVLYELAAMPKYAQRPLIQRYKVLASVNIIEYRVPQSGEIGARYDGSAYNLIVSFLPTLHGEKVVIRIADPCLPKLTLDQLGFTPDVQARLEDVLTNRRGMLLIAGATGQGKTTTQYALLNKLIQSGLTAIAVDSVYDYELSGVTQVKLNKQIGYTAEEALASVALLDIDVVALGSCPSKEALNIALQMAADSQFVIHTLSSHGPAGVLNRLLNIGAAPSLIAEGVHSILVQRLARKVCAHCKESYEICADELRPFGYDSAGPYEMVQLARGKGCEMCRNTGYKGRIGLFELMTMNAEMAEATARGAGKNSLMEAVKANGMMEMREDGLIKILQGVTTLEEIMRVVPVS